MGKPKTQPKVGTLRALRQTNTPSVSRDASKHVSTTHRATRLERRDYAQEQISATAMKARRQQRQLHELSQAALGEFPLSPEMLAVARKGVGKIRKFSKGRTVIPRDIRRLQYKGPKLPPVDEAPERSKCDPPDGMDAAECPVMGGRRRRPRTRRTRRKRKPSRRRRRRPHRHSTHRARRPHWEQLSW